MVKIRRRLWVSRFISPRTSSFQITSFTKITFRTCNILNPPPTFLKRILFLSFYVFAQHVHAHFSINTCLMLPLILLIFRRSIKEIDGMINSWCLKYFFFYVRRISGKSIRLGPIFSVQKCSNRWVMWDERKKHIFQAINFDHIWFVILLSSTSHPPPSEAVASFRTSLWIVYRRIYSPSKADFMCNGDEESPFKQSN